MPTNAKKAAGKARRPAQVPRPRAARPLDARRLGRAVARFEKAQQHAHARAADLLAVVESISSAAVARREQQLVLALRDRELLRDLFELAEAMRGEAPGTLPSTLDRLRLVPDALMQWLSDLLAVRPYGETGAERELPAESLDQFQHEFPRPGGTGGTDGLIRVRVASPGWTHNRRSIALPRVELAAKSTG